MSQRRHGRADAAVGGEAGARWWVRPGARGLWDREQEVLSDSESDVRVHDPRAEFRGSSRTLVVTAGSAVASATQAFSRNARLGRRSGYGLPVCVQFDETAARAAAADQRIPTVAWLIGHPLLECPDRI